MNAFRTLTSLLFALALLAPAAQAQLTPSYTGECRTVTLTATGRTLIHTVRGGSPVLGHFSYYTTGSPSGVSISIEAGHHLVATTNPFTVLAALTNTTGANFGTATGAYLHWYANLGTLTGGTAVVVTGCFSPGVGMTVGNFTVGALTSTTQVATTSFTSPIFQSNVADPADSGIFRLGNAENLAWEAATPGTDLLLGINASDQLVATAPILLGTTGVLLTGDQDGAITFLGNSAGSDEDLTLNLDDTANKAVISSSTGVTGLNLTGININTPGYETATACADSAGAAACGAAPAGFFVVDASATTTTVSTTAVTANSQIFLQMDESLGTALTVTCNTQDADVFDPIISARTASTSFVVTIDTGPTTNPLCLSYFIVN